jgi:uncharacterized membrane protein YphA (DoxX/SURF4 family)
VTRPEQSGRAESIGLQLPLRLALGGLFCLAAVSKLQDPQSFAEAIKAFQVVDHLRLGHLIATAAFVIPWVELVSGVMLVLGLWTRAAALTIGLALLAFIAGLVSVITRGLDASCSCFGNLNLFCGKAIGSCQVIRNSLMLLPAVYLVWRGGGRFGLDALVGGAGRCRRGGCPADSEGLDA